SEAFRTAFINRFDDMLNSAFRPERTTGIIRKMQESLQPEMAEHVARWKMPRNVDNWRDRVDNMITFAEQRPSFQRQHIRDYFGLEHDITLTVNVSDRQHGYVRINTIDINETTEGIGENAYPFSGEYFHGVPMTLEAIPAPGYQFAGWSG